ncbi:MAG: DUF5069 domain-containing protein [Candidatus Eremiobacteraeota bacterium]|nr:DUF5069 domain-containing protein [Candidatus Eremiobacteraeota bacterium]
MPTDFRDGKTFPRRGREPLDGFLWLARVIDKARAAAAGTIHDYIYPCPMDRGVFDRWGIAAEDFEAALRAHAADDAVLTWLKERVTSERRDAANRWLLEERRGNLDAQDREEAASLF